MFKLNAKFDADSLLYTVILNVMATQYTCLLNGVYRPHWLVQWSCHCSHKHIPVHFPQLPGYTDVVQTILIILTMAGLFLDRPHKRQKAKRHNSLEEPRSLRLVTCLVTISRFLNRLCSLAWTLPVAVGSVNNPVGCDFLHWLRHQGGGVFHLGSSLDFIQPHRGPGW